MLVSLLPKCSSVCCDPEPVFPHESAECSSLAVGFPLCSANGFHRNDSRFSYRECCHLTRGEPCRRRRISELLNERLVQFNPFCDQQLFLFGELHKLQHPQQVGLAFQELVGKRLFRAIERAARTGHAVFALRPEIVDTVAMPQVVVLPWFTARGSTAAHGVLI